MSGPNISYYSKLSNKYEKLKNQLLFTKEEVLRILIEKFNADEIPKEKVLDLEGSDQVDHNYVFAALNITNPETLTSLFTPKEKRGQQEEIEDNKKYPFDWSNVTPGEEEFVRGGLTGKKDVG